VHRIKTYFYLLKDRINGAGEVPVCCRISMQSDRAVLTTGLKVEEIKWNQLKQTIEDTSVLSNQKNRKLEQFQAHIYMHHSKLMDKGKYFTIKDVKKSITYNGDNKSLISMIEDHNNSMERQIGVRYSSGTLKNYKTLIKHVTNFLKKEYHLEFPLIRIDSAFVYRFEAYMLEETRCNNNGALKVLQRLQKVTTMAKQRGYIDANPFSDYRFKFEKTNRDYLTMAELKRLSDLKLNDNTLIWIRKMFFFSCFTGLSYSDVTTLKPNAIIEEDNGTVWVKTYRTKTGGRSNIPLLETAHKYIEDPYNEEYLFRPLSLQAANRGLKKLAVMAEINKKLSTHIARHTFATTITLCNDVPLETVSKMLGHSRVRTTQIYAKVIDKKVENDMSKLNIKLNF